MKDLQQAETSPGLGRGRGVSNMMSYRSADSWRGGEKGKHTLKKLLWDGQCNGKGRGAGREEVVGIKLGLS
jgi:hypothetical protein